MNWVALAAVLVLAVGAVVVWLALAAKLVANEETAKERAEAERRRLDLLREASEQERRQGTTAFHANQDVAPAARRDVRPGRK